MIKRRATKKEMLILVSRYFPKDISCIECPLSNEACRINEEHGYCNYRATVAGVRRSIRQGRG